FKEPSQDWIREIVLPFGGDEASTIGEIVDSFGTPSWLRKFALAFQRPTGDQQRLFGNTVIDVLKVMIETGEASFTTYEEAEAAFRKAESEAGKIYGIRAMSQFLGPTGGAVRFDVRDENGQAWAFQTLSSEYRAMLEAAQWDHDVAFRDFVERFGLDPSLYYTAKSRPVVRRSVTEPGFDWQREHPDLFEQFPLTAYYANPDAIEDEFDYSAYVQQLREGSRQSLSPDQWVEERNDFLGRIAYEKARQQVMDHTGTLRTDEPAVTWLRNYRFQLQVAYPGFDRVTVGLTEQVPREDLIAEMETWVDSPAMMQTPTAYAVTQYLRARSQALADAEARHGISPQGFAVAKSTRYLRDWLRKVAQSLVLSNPEFGPVWEQVLGREIEEQDEPLELLGVNF
ncbi:MAG: hypothetical protein HKO76_07695, partial [Acidimicrobiia bacterium]|nr:hypothetical protein [Acidimicrobiia bacterium]